MGPAVTAPDAATAADVLGSIRRKRVTWAHGVEPACGGAVFVAPPIGPRVLVRGRRLPDASSPGFPDRVAGLSRRLGHARFFQATGQSTEDGQPAGFAAGRPICPSFVD